MKSKLWKTASELLKTNKNIYLITVVDACGSAPNRKGAKAFISQETVIGTIGGGLSEHKLIERARKYLKSNLTINELVKLDHNDSKAPDSSGMICSGSQHYAVIALSHNDIVTIDKIEEIYHNKQTKTLLLSPQGMNIINDDLTQGPMIHRKESDIWEYKEPIGIIDKLFIVGGGHCSLALSKITKDLGFYTIVLENRKEVQTFNQNTTANEKHIINYDNLDKIIPDSPHCYITIMTFGHSYDEYALEKLINKNVKYIGMMGSVNKVKSVYKHLAERGISQNKLNQVHAPIGLDINSDTPEEIAISIAAELIQVRNQG